MSQPKTRGERSPGVKKGVAITVVVVGAVDRLRFFVLYARYSEFFPGILYARRISWTRIAMHLYIDPNSLLGIPLGIAGTVVIGIAMAGYFRRPIFFVYRILLGLGDVGLLIPPGGAIDYSLAINAVGLVVCLVIIRHEWRAGRPASTRA